MKILHVTPAYYPATYWGGPIFSVYALNNALAQLPNVTLKILTTDSAGPQLRERLNTTRLSGLYENQEIVITKRVASADVSIQLFAKLPSLVRWADVVHLTSAYSFPTIPTLAVCRALRKPLVWSPRGSILSAREWEGARHRRIKRLWEVLCSTLIRRGMVITHTTSEPERQATQARLPKARAVIVPNGVDIPAVLADREWLPNGNLRLMYLGRLSPEKGIENLLHALVQLNDPRVSLTIFGIGATAYTAELKSLAAQLGLLERGVSFAGHVNGNAKHEAFRMTDVCVVPSHTENFSMVVAEALAHGVPVIASWGTPWQQIRDKRCGLWVENSPESLGQAISTIRLCNLSQMGHRGREWMRTEFAWNSIARAMHRVYEEAMEEG
jgi:glycosyltransferase involved in cell wall biosynthesis